MASSVRQTGISVVGGMPWGTHFCHFYETSDDLLDTVVPYFKTGLDDNELCVWVVSEPLTIDEARRALRLMAPDLDRRLRDGGIEIFSAREWYLAGGTFDPKRVTAAWYARLAGALDRGYAGMRASGGAAWLQKKDWHSFCGYEATLNGFISGLPMTVLCTYPLQASSATELFDVVRTHQFAVARRRGTWELMDTPAGKHAKDEIAGLEVAIHDLRTQVVERQQAEHALETTRGELAQVTRLTTVGELTASLAHELNQPLSAIAANGGACLRWLGRDPPDLGETIGCVQRILRDTMRAGEVIARTRVLLKKSTSERMLLDVEKMIREALVFVQPDLMRRRITLRERFSPGLLPVVGARPELQQVVINLLLNGIEAMSDDPTSVRDLALSAEPHQVGNSPGVLVTVRDSGVGLSPEYAEQLFEAFFTTKRHGLGMGLSISRTIIHAHGGRLWATPNLDRGATFQFTLPAAEPSAT
jgi:signal transduction histidine kinase